MDQSEFDAFKNEMQQMLDKKFGKKQYMAVISFLDEYKFDSEKKEIKLSNQTLRVSNTTMQTPYAAMAALINGVISSIKQLGNPKIIEKKDM